MTDLKVCAGCRRHVAIEDSVCPFCAEQLQLSAAAASGTSRFGRVSRAAVFAGAALATTACGGKKPKAENVQNQDKTAAQVDAGVQQPPPPPNDNNLPMPYGAPPARRRIV